MKDEARDRAASVVSSRIPHAEAETVLAILRITLGVMFLWVFAENLGKGFYSTSGYAGLITYYINSGHAPGVWKAVMSLMAAHAGVVAPLQAVTEISFGILLVLGLLTRPVALGAFGFLMSLWISEWGTAWIWELLLPMIVALMLSAGAAGRKWGVDAHLAQTYPRLPVW